MAVSVLLLCALGVWQLPYYMHAYRLLRAMQQPARQTATSTHDIAGADKLREYLPEHPSGAPVILLLHGVHHLGIEEPRLRAFATALANEGVAVFTPELPGASSYQIVPSDIDVIGRTAQRALQESGGKQLCIMGLSFSGGLALLAADDPRYASSVRCVIAVGAHDSMQRVASFFATDREIFPDGHSDHLASHEYGPLVMVYTHPEDYFPAQDSDGVRKVLGAFLKGDAGAANSALARLPAEDQAVLSPWMQHHRDGLGNEIVVSVPLHAREMDAVSPAGRLSSLQARVLLLHGAGDTVIPPSEMLFLARDIPRDQLVSALISPAVTHVELSAPTKLDELRLLHWMAEMFREVGATAH
ncbi:MAG: alpha/beta fold hydrolase [Acidobacteriales bacterium]|nr:alpha/beta fold hydrolase [Terriglobales bacterium]